MIGLSRAGLLLDEVRGCSDRCQRLRARKPSDLLEEAPSGVRHDARRLLPEGVEHVQSLLVRRKVVQVAVAENTQQLGHVELRSLCRHHHALAAVKVRRRTERRILAEAAQHQRYVVVKVQAYRIDERPNLPTTAQSVSQHRIESDRIGRVYLSSSIAQQCRLADLDRNRVVGKVVHQLWRLVERERTADSRRTSHVKCFDDRVAAVGVTSAIQESVAGGCTRAREREREREQAYTVRPQLTTTLTWLSLRNLNVDSKYLYSKISSSVPNTANPLPTLCEWLSSWASTSSRDVHDIRIELHHFQRQLCITLEAQRISLGAECAKTQQPQ